MWQPCIGSGLTPPLYPGNRTQENVIISNHSSVCDYGDFEYKLAQEANGNVSLHTIFYSHVIEDASPPTCKLECRHESKKEKGNHLNGVVRIISEEEESPFAVWDCSTCETW